MPFPSSIYAQRTIYNGFRNAFVDLGHDFVALTSDDKLEHFLELNKPDIFITASHFFYRKSIDYKLLKKYRERGLFVLIKIDFWDSPLKAGRINEAKSLKDDSEVVSLIRDGLLGDAFFHVVEQGDGRMKGFEAATGHGYHTIPLAADKTILRDSFNPDFKADISFVGTYLSQKKEFFRDWVFPLKGRYDLKLYGQDWTLFDRSLGWVQRFGQYFNLPVIRTIRKPKLKLQDEAGIYSSSVISINIHEDYQRKFGGDCNERTFKIPLCGGFEITDDVACIRKYFKAGEEIIVVEDRDDWFRKIEFYLKNPEERLPIIEAGRERVMRDHTYHNRANQIIEIYESFRKNR